VAVARTVTEFEPMGLGWMTVEDSEGQIWKYVRTGNAPHGPVHVEGLLSGMNSLLTATLTAEGGIAILRQDAPGLPAEIVVKVIGGKPIPGSAFWSGPVAYEQVL
jgi:hypothetical protein